MPAKRLGVIYILRDKFCIFIQGFPAVLEFKFLPEMIRDLDIVNKELLQNLIKMFIVNSKIPLSNFVIIIADNASLIKDFIVSNQPQPQNVQQVQLAMQNLQEQAKKFTDHIPFDNVMSVYLPLKNGIRVYTTNKDLYEVIKESFELQGNSVLSVLPGLVFGNNLSVQPILNPAMANLILQKASTLKQYNLLMQRPKEIDKKEKENEDEQPQYTEQPQKTSKKRLILLSSVFGFLVIVLIGVYFMTNTQPTQTYEGQAAPNSASSIEALPTPTTASANTDLLPTVTLPAGTPGAQETTNLTVQIINASLSDQAGNQLRDQLTNYGFKNIEVQTQTNVNTSGILITFSEIPSRQIRNTVINEAKKFSGTVNVQEKADTGFDIMILLGK